MSEALHTPGPWVARPDPNAIAFDDWCVGIGDSTANIDKVAVCSARDAHLIAAAPDLLDACLTMIAWDHAETNARPYDEDNGKAWRERLALCAESFDKARAAVDRATLAAQKGGA